MLLKPWPGPEQRRDPSVNLQRDHGEDRRRRRRDRTQSEESAERTASVHMDLYAARCVSAYVHAGVCRVSPCYVILSRPQLLSHTQQACWGAQPTWPPPSCLLSSSIPPSSILSFSPLVFSCFPLIELAHYGFF